MCTYVLTDRQSDGQKTIKQHRFGIIRSLRDAWDSRFLVLGSSPAALESVLQNELQCATAAGNKEEDSAIHDDMVSLG